MTDYTNLLNLLGRSEEFLRLKKTSGEGDGPCSVFGVSEEAAPFLIAALTEGGKSALVVTANEREAGKLADRLSPLCGASVVELPPREVQFRSFYARSREIATARIAAIDRVTNGEPFVLVAGAEAAMQRMAPPSAFTSAAHVLRTGDRVDLEQLAEQLRRAGYERVAKVDAVGQFRIAGSLFDVFPTGSETPYRVEFFDDEVDGIRTYDPVTQRSVGTVDAVRVSPAVEAPLSQEAIDRALQLLSQTKRKKALAPLCERLADSLQGGDGDVADALLPLLFEPANLSDYLPEGALTIVVEPAVVDEHARERHDRFAEALSQALTDGDALPVQSELYLAPEPFWQMLDHPSTVCLFAFMRTFSRIRPEALFRFEAHSPARYNAALPQLASDLRQLKFRGVTVLLFAGSRAHKLQEDLLALDFEAVLMPELSRTPLPGEVLILSQGLPCGFELPEQKLSVFSEPDIYGSRKAAVKPVKRREVTRFDIFADLKIGDLVVHESYGIGVFKGIVKLTANGTTRDFMQLQYAGTDKLYVPTDQLDRVQKYIGTGEDKSPKLSKLGGGDWNRSVAKVRQSVKELAFDLVKLYADRKATPGFAFSPDSPWQRQLEEAFPYEDTPDQATSLAQIKADMESPVIMDRLLCGDVGYGKTEVAVRAAFKAVQDSKQVAFLVPTTVLASQHYQTLCSRFAGFPVRVELLSRFRSPGEQAAVIRGLKDGSVDVVVGTHALLGKRVEFKDLGLLIIDEEQRFGVGHKEAIKNIKRSVDVLTLTATPIPRTLHMALSGLRDMSVIETPPEERYPVQTYVMEYSDSLAKDAIERELARGGQVFFLYNRVSSMERFASYLRELVPDARIAIAHGQMAEGRLERTMLAFMEREYDVLLCSTIIESGLDIPNANTMIVYDADHMGLAQLYQLRGRVGRSNRIAYAYFTFRRDKVLSEIADKRLRAIREFTQFGSGFKIAMRDLEIRGAGNIVGVQQHGHMAAVGYDYYCKLVDEAVNEVKGTPRPVEIDTQMDIPMDAYLPSSYIAEESDRLEVYKRIASISGREDVPDVTDELIDRFGEPPAPVLNLIEIAAIKAAAKTAGLTVLTVRPGMALLKFHPKSQITGEALLSVLTEFKGRATLLSGDPAEVKLMQRNAEVREMAALAEGFLLRLCAGITE
ncbi:MAG: transcription-repair coupling factor [Christensenellales bacterium]|jgi:transcription-repair coupling factor (superfamily II helicase)